MSRTGSQKRVLGQFLAQLRPFWRSDLSLPLRIEASLRGDRRLGSRDRRLYRELIYTTLRYLPWIEPLLDEKPEEAFTRIAWLSARTASTQTFCEEVCAGMPPCPAGANEKAGILGEKTAALFPAWCASECPGVLVPPESDALLSRAPLWLRLQTANEEVVLNEFKARGWPVGRSTEVSAAIELPPDVDLVSTDAYSKGLVEIQDIGSQLILESASLIPGLHWLDACAGAGGKSLQLAALLGPDGRVDAFDLRVPALEQLRLRAARSSLSGRIQIVREPAKGYAGVLVDAPCSGSGTWRRSPHLKWMTKAADIRSLADDQAAILKAYGGCVRTGGSLLYSTCSLCHSENEGLVERFLNENSGFTTGALKGGGHQRRLRSSSYNGDGYFVAILTKT